MHVACVVLAYLALCGVCISRFERRGVIGPEAPVLRDVAFLIYFGSAEYILPNAEYILTEAVTEADMNASSRQLGLRSALDC